MVTGRYLKKIICKFVQLCCKIYRNGDVIVVTLYKSVWHIDNYIMMGSNCDQLAEGRILNL
jgi:hypothetical protein